MKMTIDIPDPLYTRAKIRAVESGQSLKQIVLNSLERELEMLPAVEQPRPSYWSNRKFLPEFAAAQREGAYRPKPGAPDITDSISDDRDGL